MSRLLSWYSYLRSLFIKERPIIFKWEDHPPFFSQKKGTPLEEEFIPDEVAEEDLETSSYSFDRYNCLPALTGPPPLIQIFNRPQTSYPLEAGLHSPQKYL